MNAKKRLCSQCEASIPYEMGHCPFCGQEQIEKISIEEESQHGDSLHLSELYHPPYLAQSLGEVRKEQKPFESYSTSSERSGFDEQQLEQTEKHLAKKELMIILLLSIGGQFMLLGLMLFFFSIDGVVTLQWKSQFWYLYSLFSVPFLLLGFRSLKRF